MEFVAGQPVTYLDLHAMEAEFSGLLGGRKVDLVTPAALHPLIRSRVVPLAMVVYAER